MQSISKSKIDLMWLEKITELGCIVSIDNQKVLPWGGMLVERHHINGKVKAGSHLMTIPLAPSLHNYMFKGSLHHNKAAFIKSYGTERELWHKTLALVFPESIPPEFVARLSAHRYSEKFLDLDLYESFKV